ncbi:hypothetical protein HCA69_02415 [Listeria grandensis]|uniref:YopX protein domain-containing protein n=1 Tax=Listeria grandensis TaxID=1494963 RepID=A0A7X0Y1C1_9LIST|nr:YopX family protein [Listeria grandensis]MBC1935202.1 hypothetical protein [Listeria grandensis]
MKQDIKYRAWDNVAEKMYYCGEEDVICFEVESGRIKATEASEDNGYEELVHLKYMQYLGKDINENDLYDQDICEDERGNRFLVMWSEYFLAWSYVEYLGDLREYPLHDFKGTYRKVGNKFDNPELLEIEVAE